MTITQTDQGALASAERIATDSVKRSLGFGSDALTLSDRSSARVADIADRSGKRILDATSDALTFGDRASARVADVSDNALDFGGDVLQGAAELVKGAFHDAFDLAGGVLREGQVQLGNTVSNLNAIARQGATGDAERVQDIANRALVIGAVMVGVIALAYAARGFR